MSPPLLRIKDKKYRRNDKSPIWIGAEVWEFIGGGSHFNLRLNYEEGGNSRRGLSGMSRAKSPTYDHTGAKPPGRSPEGGRQPSELENGTFCPKAPLGFLNKGVLRLLHESERSAVKFCCFLFTVLIVNHELEKGTFCPKAPATSFAKQLHSESLLVCNQHQSAEGPI